MSDTDIYKEREPMPIGAKQPDKKRRRRKRSSRAFDDPARKRRSRNSGLRRVLHLSRKGENEKYFWTTLVVVVLVSLVSVGLYQFVFRERAILEQEKRDDYAAFQRSVPRSQERLIETESAESAAE